MIKLFQPEISFLEKKAVAKVLSSGQLASGPEVAKFEKEFARWHRFPYAVATSSGTSALHTALLGVGIKKGDLVITSAFGFIATANAILYCGAKPVFVDIEEGSFNIDPRQLEKTLRKHPSAKALLITHIFGLPCDMKEILHLVKKYRISLIEDCAQALGAEYHRQKVGTFGDASAFSLYATKNITSGEGGLILTRKKALQEKFRSLINHGRSGRFVHNLLGFNYRMSEMEATLGRGQLKRLGELNKIRRQNACLLSQGIKNPGVLCPLTPAVSRHAFCLYTVRVKKNKRKELSYFLKVRQIETAAFYPLPIPEQQLYRNLGYSGKDYPLSRKACREVLSLPVHPLVKKSEITRIIKTVNQFRT